MAFVLKPSSRPWGFARSACLRLVFPISLLLAPLLLAQPASACSCSHPEDPAAYVKGTPLIASGFVEYQEVLDATVPGDRTILTHFRVLSGWKGAEDGDIVSIVTNESGASCGWEFRANTPYTVFGYGSPASGYSRNYCAMMPFESAEEVYQPILEGYRSRLQNYDTALESQPPDVTTLRSKALFLFENGDWRRAAQVLGEILERTPNDVESISRRATALIALDRHKDALSDIDAILQRRPDDASMRKNRVIALVALGRTIEVDRDTTALIGEAFDRANMTGKSLVGFDLSQTIFRNASFQGADLTGTNFERAQLSGEYLFRNARLVG